MRKTVTPIDAGDHRARVLGRRDELVRDHLALVDHIAGQIHRRLPAGVFDRDDLIQIGREALVTHALRVRPDACAGEIRAFLRWKIRGAILDATRKKHWRDATMPGFDAVTASGQKLDLLDTLATQPVAPDAIDRARRLREVAAAMAALSARHRRVLEECYSVWEPTMPQIAERLGCTVAKVYHLRSRAVDALRRELKRAA